MVGSPGGDSLEKSLVAEGPVADLLLWLCSQGFLAVGGCLFVDGVGWVTSGPPQLASLAGGVESQTGGGRLDGLKG